jgi:RNA polymerase primary sigma factor
MRQLKITKQVTNRDLASLDKYLHEIAKVDLITAEEEVALAQRIKQGDFEALEKLTKANLRFVVSVSKQYQNQGLSLPDLINEGNLGLIKAAQRFDETRGFKFISYAVWWIRQSILQAIAEQSRIVRLPLNKIGLLNKVKKCYAVLEQKYDRTPEPAEIAFEMDLTEKQIRDLLKNSGRQISVDAPVGDDDTNTMLDLMSNNDKHTRPENGLMDESLRTEINRIVATLSPRESDILKYYYGLDGKVLLTLEEIGQKYNLSRERVRQIKEKAIKSLRHNTRSGLLKSYLGS